MVENKKNDNLKEINVIVGDKKYHFTQSGLFINTKRNDDYYMLDVFIPKHHLEHLVPIINKIIEEVSK